MFEKWSTKLVSNLLVTASLLLVISGCPDNSSTPTTPATDTSHEGHDHEGHDHGGHSHGGSDTGPHGGHLVEIGAEQLHAEWTHDDTSGEVVVYLLDSSAKEDVAISDSTIAILTKVGEKQQSYELSAVSPEDGQSSRFALTDPALVEALKVVGPGVEATISVSWKDEVLVGKFEKHEHSGHKH